MSDADHIDNESYIDINFQELIPTSPYISGLDVVNVDIVGA